MASNIRPGTESTEELKRELDEHMRDDEAHSNERVPAETFLADLRRSLKPVVPK